MTAVTAAAEGSRPTDAYEMLYEQGSVGRFHLTGVVLGRLTLCHGNRVCFTEIRKGDYPTWTPLVISDAKMYLRDQDNLTCFDIKANK